MPRSRVVGYGCQRPKLCGDIVGVGLPGAALAGRGCWLTRLLLLGLAEQLLHLVVQLGEGVLRRLLLRPLALLGGFEVGDRVGDAVAALLPLLVHLVVDAVEVALQLFVCPALNRRVRLALLSIAFLSRPITSAQR